MGYVALDALSKIRVSMARKGRASARYGANKFARRPLRLRLRLVLRGRRRRRPLRLSLPGGRGPVGPPRHRPRRGLGGAGASRWLHVPLVQNARFR